MTTPATIAALKPFFIRDATTHATLPGRYHTFEEANAARALLHKYNAGRIFVIKKGWS